MNRYTGLRPNQPVPTGFRIAVGVAFIVSALYDNNLSIFTIEMLSQFQNIPVCPISESDSNFNPQNKELIIFGK